MKIRDIDQLVKRDARSTLRAEFTVKSINNDQQVVVGEVYAPYVIDSHREMMLPDALVQLAHAFVEEDKIKMVDVLHSNKWIHASIIESFIARKGDPDFQEGAWVLAVKIHDKDIWARVRRGELNGYSLEAYVYKQLADVEYDYLPTHIGLTEQNNGHYHSFIVEVDENGRVMKGWTGPAADGHTHDIRFGTATELGNDHAHRYFLNEVDEDED